MTLATRSLPVPLSPVSSTVDDGLTATRATRWRSAVIGARGADDPLQAVRTRRVRAELPHLAPEPRRLERALDRRGDLVEIERLVREVIGAELHGLDGGLDAGVRRQQNHQDVLVELLDLPQDGDAVGVGQPIVEQDEIDALGQLLHGGAPGVRLEHVVSLGLEAFGQRPANQGFVVDDKNRGFRHDVDPVQAARVRSRDGAPAVPYKTRSFTPDSARVAIVSGEFLAPWGNFRGGPSRLWTPFIRDRGLPVGRSAGQSGCGRPPPPDARQTPLSRRRGATTHAVAGRAAPHGGAPRSRSGS